MRRALPAAAALLACGVSLSAQGQAGDGALTIDQAVALGLQQNRALQRARLEAGNSDDSLATLRSRRRPQFQVGAVAGQLLGDVNMTYSSGVFGVYPDIGPIPARETNVTTPSRFTTATFARVTQPLSQLYQISIGEDHLSLARDLATERVRGEELGVANNINRLYLGMLQIARSIESRTASLALHREVERLVAEYLKEGAALPVEKLEVQALIAKEELDVQAMRDSHASLGEQLNGLLGRDVAAPLTLAPVPPDTALADDLAALEARALATRSEVKQAAIALGQARTDVRLKRAARIPDVSALVSYLGFTGYEVLPKAIALAGVTLSWEPFDWGRKNRDIAQSERVVEQAESAVRDADALVRAEVRASLRQLRQARETIRVAALGVEVARERLRVALNLYRDQKVLFRDVLQAEAGVAAADQGHAAALLQLTTARVDLERAVGGQ